MAASDLIHAATVPAPGGKLSRKQWELIERYLEEWKKETLAAVKEHPAGSFQAGYRQVMAFVDLLGRLGQVSVPPDSLGSGPTAREAQYWLERYTLHELDDALNRYIGQIKDTILYSLRAGTNPVVTASTLYKLVRDLTGAKESAAINWRAIARTEMVRAMSAGRLKACEDMGYDRVWCPPHAGACGSCRRLIENKDFPIDQVRDATNFGRKQRDWIACIPLHPHCRHAWLPYEPDVVEEAREHYRQLADAGLADDDTLDAMFDTSGQIRPEYANDPRLRAIKTRDDVAEVFKVCMAAAVNVSKTRRATGGPTLHRVAPAELADYRVDELYQRERDEQKVDGMADTLARGDRLPPAKVNHREDGQRYIMDGQHRVWGALKAGKPLEVKMYWRLPWEEEQRVCREALGEHVPLAKSRGSTSDGDASRLERARTGKGHADYDNGGWTLAELHAAAGRDDSAKLRDARRTLAGKLPSPGSRSDITVYRAHHPDDPHGHALRPGDWIAVDRGYAEDFAARNGGYPVHAETVPVEHVTWAGSNEHEWIYRPPGEVAKGFFDPPQEGRDPAFWQGQELRPEVYDRIGQWADHVLGREWKRWARIYLMGGATSREWLSHPERDSDVDLQLVVDYAKLRDERRGWRRLSDHDLHFALVATLKAGLEGQEAVPGVALDAFVRPEQNVEEFERDARRSGQAVWDVVGHRWVTQGRVLDSDDVELYGDPWLEGVGARLAEDHPNWITDARSATEFLTDMLREYTEDPTRKNLGHLREAYRLLHDGRKAGFAAEGEESRGNFMWQYAVNFGPLMQVKHLLFRTSLEKVWPDYAIDVGKMSPAAAPGTGVEHWITVHPHGEDEPGQPVLVRNNSDGTMTVIGGAGGSLNYLRLDSKRRIDSKKESGGDGEGRKLTAEQPVTDEERQRQEAEFEQRKGEAKKVIEQTGEERKQLQGQLEDYIANHVGYDLKHAQVKHTGTGETEVTDASFTEQRKAMARLQKAALHTLAYGEIDRRDGDHSPYLIEKRVGDFEGLEDGEKKPDSEPEIHEPRDDNGDTQEPSPDVESTPEEQLDRARRSLPKLPSLTVDQAQTIMELQHQIARLQRRQSKARKVLREGGTHQDSLALDWRDTDVKEEVAKRVADEQRTDVARQLLEQTESRAGNPAKVRFGKALQQGAYDSVDAITHAVLGVSAIPPAVGRLLGASGTAQLAAHAIRRRAEEGAGIDMQQVLDAVDRHTQRYELDVANTALARARKAADTAVAMREERKLSEAGQSLWLSTMTRSYEQQKMGEAGRLLGMAIGGMEATSAMKVALSRPADKLKVGGFESAAQVKELGRKAGIDIKPSDITRVGAGDYSLSLEPDRVEHLLRFDPPPRDELRDRLMQLRSGHELDQEVQAASHTPDMADTLDDAQARGKLVLTTTAAHGGGCVLAFAPGRGKTHTALAAALQRMHDENVPHGQGNTWVVCPTTAMAEWAGTIANNTTRSVQMIGKDFEHLGGGKISSKGVGGKRRQGQLEQPADFNIIGLEQLQAILKRDPAFADKIKAARVIADESQKSKNEKADRWRSLSEFSKHTSERWALSGTTVEKRLKDLGAQYHWANPERSLSPSAMEEKFGKLGQEPHVLGQDKVQQFREGLDEGLYQLGANQAALPPVSRVNHKVELDPEHKDTLQRTVQSINEQRAEARARGEQGISGVEAEGIMRQALYDRPHNAMARAVADIVDKMDDIDYDGAGGGKPGTYAPKAIVFSQFVKQLEHVRDELAGGDSKVFYAHGGMSAEENEQQLQGFLAHKGRAVLVSSDKNSTARSLQFGMNKGEFQHGATHLIHYSQPDNNAVIQQREARQWRKGAASPVTVHTLDADTPAEIRQQDRLERERRTQDLAGNSEQLVGGKDTLHHELERAKGRR